MMVLSHTSGVRVGSSRRPGDVVALVVSRFKFWTEERKKGKKRVSWLASFLDIYICTSVVYVLELFMVLVNVSCDYRVGLVRCIVYHTDRLAIHMWDGTQKVSSRIDSFYTYLN